MKGLQLLPRVFLVGVLLFFGFVPRVMLDLIGSATAVLAKGFTQ
jgi:hypothetical protein